jgi:hypothetical protein
MTIPVQAAKHAAEHGTNHILDQQIRIAREKELIVKLERENDGAAVNRAKEILKQMEEFLAQMTAAHAAAEEHLAEATIGDRSKNVERADVSSFSIVRDTYAAALVPSKGR